MTGNGHVNEWASRVAVVTGGGSGIGKAIALRLARAGAQVIAGDLRFDPAAEQPLVAARVRMVPVDVRKEADIEQLMAVADNLGGLDLLVNSAGIVLVRQIPDVLEAEWDACLDTNLKGAFLASKHAIPRLKNRGGGSIINIASNAGLLPRAHDPVYSTSKAALIALTQCLALSHSPDRIRANAICPGPVQDTRIIDREIELAADPEDLRQRIIGASPLCRAFGRMVTPEEIAESVVFLASDAAQLITGTSLAIDGGKSLGVPPSTTSGR
ncbi:MAG: 4-formylbenzenesulfonate dehydrogenase TsaC1/TsaC2 [Planctomycetota bacterium]